MPMIIMNIKLLDYINNHKLQFIKQIYKKICFFHVIILIERQIVIF